MYCMLYSTHGALACIVCYIVHMWRISTEHNKYMNVINNMTGLTCNQNYFVFVTHEGRVWRFITCDGDGTFLIGKQY